MEGSLTASFHLLKLQPQHCGGEAKSTNLDKLKRVSCKQRSRLGTLNLKLQDCTQELCSTVKITSILFQSKSYPSNTKTLKKLVENTL